MSKVSSQIISTGSYLPERIVTNDELATYVDTSHEWIVQRTGIYQRRFAAENQMTSDLAANAAHQALDNANLSPLDIDLIVLATTTPDYTFPSTATVVQSKLGCKNAFAFDVSAVCSGYLVALQTADSFLRTGQAKTALVIGAETMSRLIDMKDRRTCVLFGDGAGAVILRAEEVDKDSGVLGVYTYSDGDYCNILYTNGGPSLTQTAGYIQMSGQEVFRHAVSKLTNCAQTAMTRHNITVKDIDWMIPHQANIRIMDAVANRIGLAKEKVVATVDQHANTSAASIPLALHSAVEDGRLKRGDLILHEAIGGGLVWGSALVRY